MTDSLSFRPSPSATTTMITILIHLWNQLLTWHYMTLTCTPTNRHQLVTYTLQAAFKQRVSCTTHLTSPEASHRSRSQLANVISQSTSRQTLQDAWQNVSQSRLFTFNVSLIVARHHRTNWAHLPGPVSNASSYFYCRIKSLFFLFSLCGTLSIVAFAQSIHLLHSYRR